MARFPIQDCEITPERKRRTATHEAGHTVMAYLCGVPVQYVTIEPRNDEETTILGSHGDLGHVRRRLRFGEPGRILAWREGYAFEPVISVATPERAPLAGQWPDSREQMENEILFSLAGYAAEWNAFDYAATQAENDDEWLDESELLSEQDADGAEGSESWDIARSLTMDETEAYAYLSLLRQRARNLLALPGCQRAIETLVTFLLEDGEIAGDVAEAMIGAALDDTPAADEAAGNNQE